ELAPRNSGQNTAITRTGKAIARAAPGRIKRRRGPSWASNNPVTASARATRPRGILRNSTQLNDAHRRAKPATSKAATPTGSNQARLAGLAIAGGGKRTTLG